MDQDDIDTSHQWLVIPYFDGDEGRASQRPLSKLTRPVTSWLCPSIRVQGVGYSSPPGSYLPDRPLQITLSVDNRGVPTAQVKLRVYWADPATGFASPQLIFVTTQPVSGRAATPTDFPPLVWTPQQASIPPHFCLLVHASCTPPELDPGPLAPSPMSDRHWAQYNLQSAVLSSAGGKALVFWAGNPLARAGVYAVSARPLDQQELQRLARLIRAEPVVARPQQIALQRAADVVTGRGDSSVVLELGGREREALVLAARGLALEPDQFTAVEIVQTSIGREREVEAIGSLGMVLFGHVAETRRSGDR